MTKIEAMLVRHEGRRNRWYKDTKGLWTNGIGHLATEHDDVSRDWSDEEVDQNFNTDLADKVRLLDAQCPGFKTLDSCRQDALTDMCFNMGWHRLSKFEHMLQALVDGDFELAASEALNSKWAMEDVSYERSHEISEMIRTGEYQ